MVTIYVEGGGDAASLKSECRRAFSELLRKAGFENKMPSVRAMGGREAAFDAFKTAHQESDAGLNVLLLVDSETIPSAQDPWVHLKTQAGWEKPAGAADSHAHLMVVCMETWLLADPDTLAAYFGRNFKKDKVPTTELENRSKQDVYNILTAATSPSKPKGKYGKARDSFKLLGQIDPAKLRANCAWADRFFRVLGAMT